MNIKYSNVLIAYIGGVICGARSWTTWQDARSLNRLHWRGYLRARSRTNTQSCFVLIAYIGGVICGAGSPSIGTWNLVLIAYIGGVICGSPSIGITIP